MSFSNIFGFSFFSAFGVEALTNVVWFNGRERVSDMVQRFVSLAKAELEAAGGGEQKKSRKVRLPLGASF